MGYRRGTSRLLTRRSPGRTGADLRLLGADDRVRTGDLNLGKVALYQLSHVRVDRHYTRRPRARTGPRIASAAAKGGRSCASGSLAATRPGGPSTTSSPTPSWPRAAASRRMRSRRSSPWTPWACSRSSAAKCRGSSCRPAWYRPTGGTRSRWRNRRSPCRSRAAAASCSASGCRTRWSSRTCSGCPSTSRCATCANTCRSSCRCCTTETSRTKVRRSALR